MINNRQAGRRRGRGGQQQRSQGGGNPGRLDTGNRIDNRARGNAAQLLEKYKTLARDAQMQGDRVNVEYYLQFADHYFRVLAETRARIEENGGPVQRRIQGATLDEDDTEFEDEGERIAPAEQHRGNPNGQNGQNGYRQESRQDGRSDGSRSDGNRSDGNRQDSRGDTGRNDSARNDSARNDSVRGEPRGDGDRGYQRGNRGNGEQNNGASEARGDEQAERPRRSQNGASQEDGGYERPRDQQREASRGTDDRYVRSDSRSDNRAETRSDTREEESRPDVATSEGTSVTAEQTAPSDVAEAPRRGRGRPRRDAAATPVVAASEPKDDSADDNSFSVDLLPPSLNVSAVVSDDPEADAAEKPRRRRGRPPIVRETDPVA